MNNREVSHYVVTAHPPGGVLHTVKCNFLDKNSEDVVIAKSRRLEVRQLLRPENEILTATTLDQATAAAVESLSTTTSSNSSPFPIVLSVPIHGRITSLTPIKLQNYPTSLLFITTDQYQYAVIGYHKPTTTTPSASATATSSASASSLNYIHTYDHGSLHDDWNVLGNLSECGPLVAIDPHSRCIVIHLYDGLLSIFPILKNNVAQLAARANTSNSNKTGTGGGGRSSSASNINILGPVFHTRLEERIVLSLTMLHHNLPQGSNQQQSLYRHPHVCLLHQDSRGAQHISTHVIDLSKSQLWSMTSSAGQTIHGQSEWLKKSRIDGGSSLLIPVPPRRRSSSSSSSASASAVAASASASAAQQQQEQPTANNNNNNNSGGVVILGQRQITFVAIQHYKVMPIPPALILSWDKLPEDVATGMPRYLLGDEFGNLHMLTLITQGLKVVALQLDTLGSCSTLSQSLQYLDQGMVFCGSNLGDSQLVQIHDEPIPVDDSDFLDYGNNSNSNNAMMQQEEDNDNDNDGEGKTTGGGGGNNNVDDNALELGDTTYLSVIEEYTNLGPIVDFDLVHMDHHHHHHATSTGAAGASAATSTAAGADGTVVPAAATPRNPSSSSSANKNGQQQVVTASGSSKSGSIRLIRNGIGMKEYASVELSGIQNMWSLRSSFDDASDSYLVQSFVGETRVLGVVPASMDEGNDVEDDKDRMKTDDDDEKDGDKKQGDDDDEEDDEEVGGTLEEVVLPGLESSASTLYVTNVIGNLFLQITDSQLRLASSEGEILDVVGLPMTVATANEVGQILVALHGGKVLYYQVVDSKLKEVASKQMDREVSCLDVHPFRESSSSEDGSNPAASDYRTERASLCAVGLWDDFTVRLLSLDSLSEVLTIHLSTELEDDDNIADQAQRRSNRNNMMARSLCLITLDFSFTGNNPGVNMLFVGLGDGTLVSFAVVTDDKFRVQSKKEVSLGTQRINLIPLHNEKGGTCVLATGDRPTVIYLAGAASNAKNYNPKLCYSNVNLSPAEDGDANDVSRPHAHQSIAVNVAAPFFSPLLFDSMGQEHYSLCVADDANLRLGVIDDIQKLHVTTCRLGMAPRRIVHCPEGRLFAVGCIESGIKQVGMGGGEMSMGNCIRFLDDITLDDIQRIDLEPCEMVLSMASVSLRTYKSTLSPSAAVPTDSAANVAMEDGNESPGEFQPYLVIGTAYAMHDEDEPTKGRLLVLSCTPDDDTGTTQRSIRTVTELQVRGGIYSMCQFYEGRLLATVNSKTQMYQLVNEGTGVVRLAVHGVGHHGHILSLFVSSRANKMLGAEEEAKQIPAVAAAPAAASAGDSKKPAAKGKEMLAIVGDLMRSISLVQYYPQHETLEEVARDFNSNWTTSVAMLTDDVYLGGENWNNLFVLRRNTKAQSEEVRCRLDTVGEFHLGEMCNKFMSGSLVMPSSTSEAATSKSSSRSDRRRSLASPKKGDSGKVPASPGGAAAAMRSRRPVVAVGSQTLFGTVDGTLGAILGLDGPTAAFFSCLERSMQKVITPVGHFSHQNYRAFNSEQRLHPSHGFVDGDLVESFLDLDKSTMTSVVQQMNWDGGWNIDDLAFSGDSNKDNDAMEDDQKPELSVDDVLAVVEEMTMLH